MAPPLPLKQLGQATSTRRRPRLAVFAILVALSAYVGAAALATGLLELDGGRLNGRLPFDSPVFGAVALVAIVAVPFTLLAWRAAHGDQRSARTAVVAGVLLVGWIVVELAFLRELSFFHPLYATIGAIVIAIGGHEERSPQP